MSADSPADDADRDWVVLVDDADRSLGVAEKMAAHREGKLHRAFSVFVFDERGALLLQRRAGSKYHSPGLWTNTCCSHPRPGEGVEAAAHRRLREEMGFDCELRPLFSRIYRAEMENGLIEHEYDHVYIGRFDGEPAPDPDEVGEWRRADMDQVRREVEAAPERYTAWFRILFPELEARTAPVAA